MVKNLPANAGDIRGVGFVPWVRKITWRRATHSSLLVGESHGQWSLASYGPWGWRESDTTEAT